MYGVQVVLYAKINVSSARIQVAFKKDESSRKFDLKTLEGIRDQVKKIVHV